MSDLNSHDDYQENSDTILKSDSRERVALDLFNFIYEQADDMPEDMTRKDMLVLYNQCYNATLGVDPDDIIPEE